MDYKTGIDFSRKNVTHLRPSISMRVQDSNGSPTHVVISILQAHELYAALGELLPHYPLPEIIATDENTMTLKHASGYVEKLGMESRIELI